jgi:hypothetical protein
MRKVSLGSENEVGGKKEDRMEAVMRGETAHRSRCWQDQLGLGKSC